MLDDDYDDDDDHGDAQAVQPPAYPFTAQELANAQGLARMLQSYDPATGQYAALQYPLQGNDAQAGPILARLLWGLGANSASPVGQADSSPGYARDAAMNLWPSFPSNDSLGASLMQPVALDAGQVGAPVGGDSLSPVPAAGPAPASETPTDYPLSDAPHVVDGREGRQPIYNGNLASSAVGSNSPSGSGLGTPGNEQAFQETCTLRNSLYSPGMQQKMCIYDCFAGGTESIWVPAILPCKKSIIKGQKY